jgi:putative ABC transport system permease protein
MIGVMFLIAVISIVEGMSKYMEEDFAGKLIGANTLSVRRILNIQTGNVTNEMWREWQRRPRIYEADVRIIREALPPGTPTAIQSEDFVYATSPYARRRQVQAVATDGEYFTIKKYNLTSGRVFSPQEAEAGTPVVVIGTEVADHFFPDLDPVGREIKIAGMPYSVIGVIEKQGNVFGFSLDRLAIAPYRSPLSRITNPRGDVDGLTVQGATRDQLGELQELVRETMRSRRKLSPSQPDNFEVETSDSALSFFDEIKGKMVIFGTALPAIGLLVGAMVIMNIMLVAVAERTREIGVRKALGARRRDIMRQFLVRPRRSRSPAPRSASCSASAAPRSSRWHFPSCRRASRPGRSAPRSSSAPASACSPAPTPPAARRASTPSPPSGRTERCASPHASPTPSKG